MNVLSTNPSAYSCFMNVLPDKLSASSYCTVFPNNPYSSFCTVFQLTKLLPLAKIVLLTFQILPDEYYHQNPLTSSSCLLLSPIPLTSSWHFIFAGFIACYLPPRFLSFFIFHGCTTLSLVALLLSYLIINNKLLWNTSY